MGCKPSRVHVFSTCDDRKALTCRVSIGDAVTAARDRGSDSDQVVWGHNSLWA